MSLLDPTKCPLGECVEETEASMIESDRLQFDGLEPGTHELRVPVDSTIDLAHSTTSHTNPQMLTGIRNVSLCRLTPATP